MDEKFLLIDGSSLIHRAFFALPPLTNKKGVNTGAVYGLCNMILKLLQEIKPSYMLVAFDKSRKTFRTEKFPDYKGQRKATPPELKEQFPLSIRLLQAMGIPTLEVDNYEADDIIGTLSSGAPDSVQVRIVTGDRDEFQLIKNNVQVLFTKKGISNIAVYDEKAFGEEYQGLEPRQIIDLKGLMGDTSDNIPGVPGVGPKTALKLITQYGTVENTLDHAEEVKGKALQEKLRNNRDQALLSKDLATICLQVPIEKDPAAYPLTGLTEESRKLMQELQFKNLWDRFVPVLGCAAGTEGASDDPLSLFGQPVAADTLERVEISDDAQGDRLVEEIRAQGDQVALAYVLQGNLPSQRLEQLDLVFAGKHYVFHPEQAGKQAVLALLENPDLPKAVADPKELYKYMMGQGKALQGVTDDPSLAGYLYEPGASSYGIQGLGEGYSGPGAGAPGQAPGTGTYPAL